MTIAENAYNSNVGVNFENVTITDNIGGSYYVAGIDSGTVTVTRDILKSLITFSKMGWMPKFTKLGSP